MKTRYILFEDTNIKLKWNISFHELLKVDNPTVVDKNDRTEILWQNKTLLKGLKCNPKVVFWNDAPLEQKRFEKLEMNFGASDDQAMRSFENVQRHLIKHYGKPLKVEKEDEFDKTLSWIIDGNIVRLSLFEMHALRCTLIIKLNN